MIYITTTPSLVILYFPPTPSEVRPDWIQAESALYVLSGSKLPFVNTSEHAETVRADDGGVKPAEGQRLCIPFTPIFFVYLPDSAILVSPPALIVPALKTLPIELEPTAKKLLNPGGGVVVTVELTPLP